MKKTAIKEQMNMEGDNNILILLIISCILLVIGTALVISFFYMQKNRQLRHAHEVMRSQIEIQEQSFHNISQEIHDNIGQVLSLVKLNLNTVDEGLPELMHEKLRTSRELIGRAITDLRGLSKSLNADIIREIGLSEAIKRELTGITRCGCYRTIFRQQGRTLRFSDKQEIILFRLFQELLNNIVDYSQAKTVNVRLLYRPQVFNLRVSDDGQGFDLSRARSPEDRFALGIRSLQTRATLIGANFLCSSSPGKGTTVSIELPLERRG
jgi:two-component system, NarL family, sensor kinase